MAGCQKRTRKKRAGSGARKNRAGKNCARRATTPYADTEAANYIRHQATNRWPDEETRDKAWKLAKDEERNKKALEKRREARKNIKPQVTFGFTLLELATGGSKAAVDKLLVAASLARKRVRRYPGVILIRTYDLHNRPITIV